MPIYNKEKILNKSLKLVYPCVLLSKVMIFRNEENPMVDNI